MLTNNSMWLPISIVASILMQNTAAAKPDNTKFKTTKYEDKTISHCSRCTDGPQGVAGPPGPLGLQGIQGVQGVQGPQGVRGATGAPGVTGRIGHDGASGSIFHAHFVFFNCENVCETDCRNVCINSHYDLRVYLCSFPFGNYVVVCGNYSINDNAGSRSNRTSNDPKILDDAVIMSVDLDCRITRKEGTEGRARKTGLASPENARRRRLFRHHGHGHADDFRIPRRQIQRRVGETGKTLRRNVRCLHGAQKRDVLDRFQWGQLRWPEHVASPGPKLRAHVVGVRQRRLYVQGSGEGQRIRWQRRHPQLGARRSGVRGTARPVRTAQCALPQLRHVLWLLAISRNLAT